MQHSNRMPGEHKINIEEAATFTIRSTYDNAKAAAAKYAAARDYRNMSPGQLNAQYTEANDLRRQSLAAVGRHNRNLETLGFDEKQRIGILKRAGVSTKDILATMDGKYTDLPRQKTQSTSDIYDGLPQDSTERRAAIQQILRTDPELGRKLMNNFNREQTNERRGLTNRDELIKNLSVAERAQMILQADDPRATLREYQRKGIATPAVVGQVMDALKVK